MRVRAAFNAVDPEELLANGFPEDEYNPEVTAVCEALTSGAAMSADLVLRVLHEFFPPMPLQDAAAIAIARE